jgi:hypothetical protein
MTVLPGVVAPRSVLVIGGHVRNRLLLEIKASVYCQKLRVIAEAEATALGAALLGGIAAGLWPDLGAALMEVRREELNIEPRVNWVDAYEEIFMRCYSRLMPLLRPVSESLQHVLGHSCDVPHEIRRCAPRNDTRNDTRRSTSSVGARILAWGRRPPVRQRPVSHPVNLDLERMAFGGITGMAGSAIAARAGG